MSAIFIDRVPQYEVSGNGIIRCVMPNGGGSFVATIALARAAADACLAAIAEWEAGANRKPVPMRLDDQGTPQRSDESNL